MPSDVLILLALVAGLGLGTLGTVALYAGDLRRIARFLRERDRRSNARVTRGAGAPGVKELADAINTELDRSLAAQVDALRRQQEFQRDLSALSHDIRTPLTGAKGYLQLASTEADPAERAGHLDAAGARIDATCELLDQLFAYTKSTDPDLALDRHPVALKPLVERVLIGSYPAFEERGWEPTLTFSDPAVRIEANDEALERILTNLVVNALRHGTGAPAIQQDVVAGAGGERVRLVISNPVAHPEAIDVARLFDRFYQADAARGANGSGLGLSVAANLARAQGMELSAHLDGNELAFVLVTPRA